MFDAHLKYYAYANVLGDKFGIGYLGNKEDWIDRINSWNRDDGNDIRYTVEDWDELDCEFDFRGCLLAEIEPDEADYLVTWSDENSDYTIRIVGNGTIMWEENEIKNPSVPRWINALSKSLKSDNL